MMDARMCNVIIIVIIGLTVYKCHYLNPYPVKFQKWTQISVILDFPILHI